MSRVFNLLTNKIKPYTSFMAIFLVLILFGFASYYGYNKFYKNAGVETYTDDVAKNYANKPNPDGEGNGKTITIYYFFADWCPHCKKTRGDWNDFAGEYNGKIVNGYNIICYAEDCSNKDKPTQLQTRYNVFQYPTVKAVRPDKGEETEIVFENKITKSNLEKFVEGIAK